MRIVVIASGGAPSTLDIDLQDGTYLVNGYDSWGDGWNGNVLTIDGMDGQTTNFSLGLSILVLRLQLILTWVMLDWLINPQI